MLNFMFLGTNGSMQGDEGNTSLLFKGSRGTVLVDASCGLGRAVAADVNAVVLTHEHIDHVYGLPSLIHQLWLSGRRRALDICVPAGMEEFVHRFLEVFSLQEKKNMFDFRIRTGRQFSVGSMEITLFSTEHTETSVGLVVREGEDRVVYTSDTRPIREILPCMAGAQVLIHEASGCEAEEEILWKKGHSSGAWDGCICAIFRKRRNCGRRFWRRRQPYFPVHVFRRWESCSEGWNDRRRCRWKLLFGSRQST